MTGNRTWLLAAAALAACVDGGDGRAGEAALEILGGTLDLDDTAVVGIYVDGTGATCTGSLIAPNLVLTARHCVSELPAMFDCETAVFGPTLAPGTIYVTTQPNILMASPADFYPAAAIGVEPGPGLVCGDDIAVLVLQSAIPASEAAPLEPRVELAGAPPESYSAIGYGATTDFGTDSGERRRRDGLAVVCAGEACKAGFADSEWQGNEGVCAGDSGGPALDALGRVFGVVSRGSSGCLSPVYEDVSAHADWLKDEALEAAAIGGYPAPPWATGEPTGTGGEGGTSIEEGGAGGAVEGGNGGTSEGGAGAISSGTTSAGGATIEDGDDGDGCRVGRAEGAGHDAGLLTALALLLGLGAHRHRSGHRARNGKLTRA